MRTRCKFRVVGVEDTEGVINRKVYKKDLPAEEYAAIAGSEQRDYNNGYIEGSEHKYVPTGKYTQNIRLCAQYDSNNKEDVSFAEATPSGTLTIYVNNPAVVGTFKPGDNYYLDLTPCDK